MVGIEIRFAQIIVRSIVDYEIWRDICVAHDGKTESLDAMVDVNAKPDLAIREIKRHVDTLWVSSIVGEPGELSQQAQAVEVMEDLNICGIPTTSVIGYHFVAGLGRFVESMELLNWYRNEIVVPQSLPVPLYLVCRRPSIDRGVNK